MAPINRTLGRFDLLNWFVLAGWSLAVLFAVLALQDMLCRRIWEGAARPVPYRVFLAFARRHGRISVHGPSEDDRARYGSHLLRFDHPAVLRANRWIRATTAIGVLALGLFWPIRAILPE